MPPQALLFPRIEPALDEGMERVLAVVEDELRDERAVPGIEVDTESGRGVLREELADGFGACQFHHASLSLQGRGREGRAGFGEDVDQNRNVDGNR